MIVASRLKITAIGLIIEHKSDRPSLGFPNRKKYEMTRRYILSIYNPGQSIWNKTEKSSKTGQEKKSLMSTFACFLTAITKV